MDRKTIIHLAAARSAELVPTRAVSAVRREGTPYYQPTLLWTSLAVHGPAHGSYFHQDLLPRLPHLRKRLESRARQADENCMTEYSTFKMILIV